MPVTSRVIFATDWGWWGVEASGQGVVCVVLPPASPQVVAEMLSAATGCCEGLAQAAAEQIQEYLGGRRQQFTVSVDWEHLSAFARRILEVCARIPYGKTISYGRLACLMGKPGAARAVGQVLAANPVPLIVPCHRVICADGRLGGFSAGRDLKQRLLALEGLGIVAGE